MKCDTKYPILLIHGMGPNDCGGIHICWGRIPRVLRENGARVFFGKQDGHAASPVNALGLAVTVREVLAKTKSEKVNIIAYSKGGLESRYLISSLGFGDRVASLTLISSPNHGSKTVDAMYNLFRPIAFLGSKAMDVCRIMAGDKYPDTYTAINEFTSHYMKRFNRINKDDPRVFYQSFAFVMGNSASDLFFCPFYLIVKLFEGENDGLVTPANARYTNFRGVFRSPSGIGISHLDECDFLRRDFSKTHPKGKRVLYNIPELYVKIVSDLKRRGF